ncbi:MAG: phenylalanine--tRNA ligase subunit alpha [Candidatus Aenigmarchaeota archaeon]|nr:phenylalanine--tRNA ligase subunit alpha [Candidatus Aenigmarchaeota archaeon]
MGPYVLTEEGKRYLSEGLPELNLLKMLENGSVPMKTAQSMENFSVAIQWAKKNGWVEVRNGVLVLVKIPGSYEIESALNKIYSGESLPDGAIQILLQRNLIQEDREDARRRAEKYKGSEVSSLNEDLIKTGYWKETIIRPYNVEAVGGKIYPGKKQPYAAFLDWVKNKMVGLGFEEMNGPIVETEFWNMDALYMHQFHAARDIHDAYFVKEPRYAKSLDKNILNAVKKSHENGTSESRGWEYQYDVKRAHRLILRTQGTALSARTLSGRPNVPGKYFSIARCFRYDVVDATHLPDFYQLEGIVIDKDLTIRHLIGLLKMFAREFANSDRIRIRPGYFPFTEPSCELFVKHPQFGWLELAGAGIFRHELTQPLGIKHPVLAWGIGLDRIFMSTSGINDIRDLFSYDLNFLRKSEVVY